MQSKVLIVFMAAMFASEICSLRQHLKLANGLKNSFVFDLSAGLHSRVAFLWSMTTSLIAHPRVLPTLSQCITESHQLCTE